MLKYEKKNHRCYALNKLRSVAWAARSRIGNILVGVVVSGVRARRQSIDYTRRVSPLTE